jgi:hypothetical protein
VTKEKLRYLPVESDSSFVPTQKFICKSGRTTLQVFEKLLDMHSRICEAWYEARKNPLTGPMGSQGEHGSDGESSSGEFPPSEDDDATDDAPLDLRASPSVSAFSPVSTNSAGFGERLYAKKTIPAVVRHASKQIPAVKKKGKVSHKFGHSDMAPAPGPNGGKIPGERQVYVGYGGGGKQILEDFDEDRKSDDDYDPDDQEDADDDAGKGEAASVKGPKRKTKVQVQKAKEEKRSALIKATEYERTRQADLNDKAKLDSIGSYEDLFFDHGATIDLQPSLLVRAREKWCTRDFDARHCASLENSFIENTQRYMFQIVCVFINPNKERHEITEGEILRHGGPYEVIAGSHTFVACQHLSEQFSGNPQNYWKTIPVRFLINPTAVEILTVGFRHNRATATKLELSSEDLLLYFRRVFKDPIHHGCANADGFAQKSGPLKRRYEEWRDVCLKAWYTGTGAVIATVRLLYFMFIYLLLIVFVYSCGLITVVISC